jgi:non-heme chloroperoxidase
VVFVQGLWLLPSSWDRWRTRFEEAGYATLAPSWPDDPNSVEEANRHPEVMAHKSIGQIAEHFEYVISKLDAKPAVVGHSFGGLLTQILAGRGVASASVAIDPAPFPAHLLPQVSLSGDRQSSQPQSRRAPDLRPVPVRLRQCRE